MILKRPMYHSYEIVDNRYMGVEIRHDWFPFMISTTFFNILGCGHCCKERGSTCCQCKKDMYTSLCFICEIHKETP